MSQIKNQVANEELANSRENRAWVRIVVARRDAINAKIPEIAVIMSSDKMDWRRDIAPITWKNPTILWSPLNAIPRRAIAMKNTDRNRLKMI